MRRATLSLLICLVGTVTGCQSPCCQTYSGYQPQCQPTCAPTCDPCKPKWSLSSLFGNKNDCCCNGVYGGSFDNYGVAPMTFDGGVPTGTFAPDGSCPTCNSNAPIPGVVSYGTPINGGYVNGPIAPGVTYPTATTYAPQPMAAPVNGMVASPPQQYWTPGPATTSIPASPVSAPAPAY